MSISQISTSSVERYLALSGWSRMEHANARVHLFTAPDDDVYEGASIILPTSKEAPDYQTRILQALDTVSTLEGSSVEELSSKILAPMLDVMRVKVQRDKRVRLTFEEACAAINNLRDLCYFGASYQANSKAFLRGGSPVGKKFVSQQCNFGHTFEGSFGFTIEVQLEDDEEPVPAEPPKILVAAGKPAAKVVEKVPEGESGQTAPVIPFARLVTERIIKGLHAAKQSEKDKSVEALLSSADQGLNGNMCAALSNLFGAVDNREVAFKVEWSPLYGKRPAVFRENITINSTTARFLDLSAQYLKRQAPLNELITVTGEVIELKLENDDVDPLDRFERERRIVLLGNDEKKHLGKVGGKVRIYLPEIEYSIACNAHRDKKQIQITGQLEKKNNAHYLTNPHDLRVID